MRAMHPKSPAERRWGIHRANILPPRGAFAVRSPQIMHGARILPPSGGPAPAQGLLTEQPHHRIAFQRLGPCSGVPAPGAPPIPVTCQCLPLAVPVAVSDKPPMDFGGGHSAHGLQFGQAPRDRRLHHLGVRPTTECCAELGLDSRTVSKWAQNLRRRPQARPVLRQRCRKRPSKGRIPLGGTIGTPHPFPIAQKKPTPEINPRVSFICVLSCIQPVRVSSCFTLGSFSAGCRPFFGLAPAAQQRFGASKLAVASLQGTTFRQSASPARRLTLAARYWTSAFHRPCRLQYSYTAIASSPGTTAKSALGSSPG